MLQTEKERSLSWATRTSSRHVALDDDGDGGNFVSLRWNVVGLTRARKRYTRKKLRGAIHAASAVLPAVLRLRIQFCTQGRQNHVPRSHQVHIQMCEPHLHLLCCPQKRAADLQRRTRKDGKTMSLAQTKRTNELEKDMNAWEENRLLTSGVARLKEVCCVCVLMGMHPCSCACTVSAL